MADLTALARTARRGGLAVLAVVVLVGCGAETDDAAPPAASASSVAVSGQATSASAPAASITAAADGTSAGPTVSTAVPWVDDPVVTEPPTTTTTALPSGEPCRTEDLTVSSGGTDGAMGTEITPILFTNKGPDPCVLDGHPTVAGVAQDGHVVQFEAPAVDGWAPGLPGAIGHGDVIAVNLLTSWACDDATDGRTDVWDTLEIGLPSGGAVPVDVAGLDLICGVQVSPFGRPDVQPPIEPTPPPSPLTASITAPPTVAAGSVLHYTVVVTNPTGSDLVLDPCPVYEQYVTTFSGADEDVAHPTLSDQRLNCSAVAAIPAGGAVTFEMQLTVPADQPPGDAKFGWSLVGGSGPFATGPMTVTAA